MAAILRASFGYCFLVFMSRIVGRRPGKQITPFEYVLIFFIGGLTLTFMVGDDRSVTNAIGAIIMIALTHFLITWLKQRSPAFGRFVDGTPLVLINKGQWQVNTMRRMRLQDDDVMASARDKGIATLEEIDYAVLERNGEISVLKARESE